MGTTIVSEKERKDLIDLFSALALIPKDARGYVKGYSQAVLDYEMYKAKKEGA